MSITRNFSRSAGSPSSKEDSATISSAVSEKWALLLHAWKAFAQPDSHDKLHGTEHWRLLLRDRAADLKTALDHLTSSSANDTVQTNSRFISIDLGLLILNLDSIGKVSLGDRQYYIQRVCEDCPSSAGGRCASLDQELSALLSALGSRTKNTSQARPSFVGKESATVALCNAIMPGIATNMPRPRR